DDAVDKAVLARLVRGHFAGKKQVDPTPLPSLKEGKVSVGIEAVSSASFPEATAKPLVALKTPDLSKPGKVKAELSQSPTSQKRAKTASSGTTVAAVTQDDCTRWLQHALQIGKGKEGAEALLRAAEACQVFRGKRMALQPVRAAMSKLGL
ncbi:unnamed protein product, partial [Polarella glacialis]